MKGKTPTSVQASLCHLCILLCIFRGFTFSNSRKTACCSSVVQTAETAVILYLIHILLSVPCQLLENVSTFSENLRVGV